MSFYFAVLNIYANIAPLIYIYKLIFKEIRIMNNLKQQSLTPNLTDKGTPSFLITICKTDVINYIKEAYGRLHDYAVFHNQNDGERATKVLNEVIFDVLQNPAECLAELLHTMAGQYTELDMLVLQTIKDRSTINPKN